MSPNVTIILNIVFEKRKNLIAICYIFQGNAKKSVYIDGSFKGSLIYDVFQNIQHFGKCTVKQWSASKQ